MNAFILMAVMNKMIGHIGMTFGGDRLVGSSSLSMFPIELSVSKLTLLNLLEILGYFSTNISPAAHIYQQSVANGFTICGICSVFAIALIWMVQNYLQLLSCSVASIIAIHLCMVLPTLTSQGFRIDWPRLVTKSPPFT